MHSDTEPGPFPRRLLPTLPGLGLMALAAFLPNLESCDRVLVPVTAVAEDPGTVILFGSHWSALWLVMLLCAGLLRNRASRLRGGLLPLALSGLTCAFVFVACAKLVPGAAVVLIFAIIAAFVCCLRSREAPHATRWPWLVAAFAWFTIGADIVIFLGGPPLWGGFVFVFGSAWLLVTAHFAVRQGPAVRET